jgi:site-specific recombinase XerD
VPQLRLHDLRHSFGSLLAAGGVDLVNIQGAMGHSQIQTTMIYMHAKDAKEQADMFTKALATPDEQPGSSSAAPDIEVS